MFASVNFFEKTPFFPSSSQEAIFFQQVLPIPFVDLSINTIPNTIPSSSNTPNSSHPPSSPGPSPPTPMTSQIPHNESLSSSPSASLSHAMTPDNGILVGLLPFTRYSLYLEPLSYL